jgi:Ni,Fe-hydrogenase III large subunit
MLRRGQHLGMKEPMHMKVYVEDEAILSTPCPTN